MSSRKFPFLTADLLNISPEESPVLRIFTTDIGAAILLTSIDIPMILAGNEFGNTQYGNNNPVLMRTSPAEAWKFDSSAEKFLIDARSVIICTN